MTDVVAGLAGGPLDDLTIPRPGSDTMRRVLSAALRATLQALPRLPVAGIEPAAVSAYQGLVRRLATIARRDAGALASLVRRPNVGTLVECLRSPGRTDIDRDACLRRLVVVATHELGAMGAWPEAVEVPFAPTSFASWVHRAAIEPPPGTTGLRVQGSDVRALVGSRREPVSPRTHDDHGALWAPITPTAWLVRIDDSPLAQLEAHPGKHGNAIDLGGRTPVQWTSALGEALELVGTHLPSLRADIDLVLQQVVPVGYDAERHLSASYAENVGTVYASLHDDPMTMAEAVIHEVSHNKLNALSRLDPILHRAFEPVYASPVRPDPRPLHGVLLAVHAFVPVAELYARMRAAGHPWAQRPDFRRRHEAIVAGNREGAEVLRTHAEPTAVGEVLLAELLRLTAAS